MKRAMGTMMQATSLTVDAIQGHYSIMTMSAGLIRSITVGAYRP